MDKLIKGDELMVFINGKSVAFSTSHNMSITGNTIELNCKDHGYWGASEIGNITWEITSENLYTDNCYDDLFDAMIHRSIITIVFGYASNYDENGLRDILPYWKPDAESGYYIGEAYITSLTANANSGENATFSVTFSGAKALTTTNESIPDTPNEYVGVIDSDYALQLINYTIDEIGSYSLRYEDENNNIISNFTPLAISEYNLITENIAPYNASHFGLYDGNVRKGTIALNTLKKSFGTRKYRFGLLADVHYDSTLNNQYNSSNDFRNAIKFFEDKEDVDFVLISGDISAAQSAGDYRDFEYFKQDIDNISLTTPVFIARGNHDIGCLTHLSTAEGDAKWNEYAVSKVLNGINLIYQYDAEGNKTANFYFNYQDDVFVILSLYSNSFWPAPSGTNAFLESSYDWLKGILEANKNKRVFIVEHVHLRDKAGNYKGHYANSFNSWFTCGGDYDKFNALNNKYTNSIWIQGHTHFKLDLQHDYDRANITNINPAGGICGYNVHVSSCACPRDSDPNTPEWQDSTINKTQQSEGAIIDVYDDYIDYRGVIFKDDRYSTLLESSDYCNLYTPVAQYRMAINKEGL